MDQKRSCTLVVLAVCVASMMLAVGRRVLTKAGAPGAGAVAAGATMERTYTISTEQKYATSGPPHFVGKFQRTRAVLDYTWHAHYEPSRQHVQDAIVDTFLSGGVRVEQPWIVYTAGAMGAGESRLRVRTSCVRMR